MIVYVLIFAREQRSYASQNRSFVEVVQIRRQPLILCLRRRQRAERRKKRHDRN